MPDSEGRIRPVSVPEVPWHAVIEFTGGGRITGRFVRGEWAETYEDHSCCNTGCSRCKRKAE